MSRSFFMEIDTARRERDSRLSGAWSFFGCLDVVESGPFIQSTREEDNPSVAQFKQAFRDTRREEVSGVLPIDNDVGKRFQFRIAWLAPLEVGQVDIACTGNVGLVIIVRRARVDHHQDARPFVGKLSYVVSADLFEADDFDVAVRDVGTTRCEYEERARRGGASEYG